jgi:hypothetical protein
MQSDAGAPLLHGLARSSFQSDIPSSTSQLPLMRRHSIFPSTRLFRATVRASAPDLLNVTVRCVLLAASRLQYLAPVCCTVSLQLYKQQHALQWVQA